MEIYRVLELSSRIEKLYFDLSFLKELEINERTFKNRWRTKNGCGLVVKCFYIEKIKVYGKCRAN